MAEEEQKKEREEKTTAKLCPNCRLAYMRKGAGWICPNCYHWESEVKDGRN